MANYVAVITSMFKEGSDAHEVCRTRPAPSKGKRRRPGLCLLPQGSPERLSSFFPSSSFAFSWDAGVFLASIKACHWAGMSTVACFMQWGASSLQLALCSHKEKGLLGGSSECPRTLCGYKKPTLAACSHVHIYSPSEHSRA